jgi:hypothetical protein
MGTEPVQEGCTHSWRTCPIHGTGSDELPPFRTVVLCVYGGAPTKDGGTFDKSDADAIVDRIVDRAEGGR